MYSIVSSTYFDKVGRLKKFTESFFASTSSSVPSLGWQFPKTLGITPQRYSILRIIAAKLPADGFVFQPPENTKIGNRTFEMH